MTGDLSHAVDRRSAHHAAPRSDAGARAAAPLDLCRLTVLARSVQIDLALPVDVPIALLVPGIVEMVGSRGGDETSGMRWVLSKVGRPPLDGTLTLNDADVRDGELLVLGAADSPAPAPLFDDVMHAVANAGGAGVGRWSTGTARAVGFGIASVAVALACLALVRVPLHEGDEFVGSVELAGIASAVAVVLLLTGTITGRLRPRDTTGVFLSGCAVPLIFTAGVLFVPGAIGAAHVLLGAAAAGATAILAARLGGHGAAPFTGIATASVVAVLAASILLFTEASVVAVGAGTAVLALIGLATAPRVSMMQSRLPLPPVPTAGAPLDESGEDDHASAADLDAMSQRARQYLTGLVGAAGAVAAAGATMTAFGHGSISDIYWPGTALALLVAAVLILRGRTFAEVQHAVPLVASGAAIVLVMVAALGSSAAHSVLLAVATALGVAVVAVLFGSFVPMREYSPVLRRAAELAEYAVIAAIIPIACWVCGLYAAMRAL